MMNRRKPEKNENRQIFFHGALRIYLGLAIMSILFILVTLISFRFAKNNIPLCVVMDVENENITIDAWYSEQEDAFYIFLPSYANEENTKLSIDRCLKINGEVVDNSWLTSHFFDESVVDDEYVLTYRSGLISHKCKIVFSKSENIGSLFLTTANGTLQTVREDKNKKEAARVVVVDSNGDLDYSGTDCIIKGHGNSTWGKDKKPYTLQFENTHELLQMTESCDWVLLANAFDCGAMRNKIVYDFAREIGMELVSDCQYIDLYANGEYLGLYQLAQSPKGLFESVKGENDATLYSVEHYRRIEEKDEAIQLAGGNYLEARYKNDNYNGGRTQIERLNLADDIIMSKDAELINSVIDVEAWAKRYLVDEIFENYDAGVTSSYLYVYGETVEEQLILPGPIWDYDHSMGNLHAKYGTTNDPAILYAANGLKTDYGPMLWYKELYENDTVYAYITEIYSTKARDLVKEIIDYKLDELALLLESAYEQDTHRNGYEVSLDGYVTEIREYLTDRVNFLDDIWTEGNKYNVIIVDGMMNEIDIYYLKEGESLLDSHYFGQRYSGQDLLTDEGEIFDISCVISEGMSLVATRSVKKSIYEKLYYNWELLLFAFLIAVMGGIFIIMVFYEFTNCRAGGNRKDG